MALLGAALRIEGKPVKAETNNLREILTPERRYVIPTIQRDYEWTRENQWELLFSDLDATAQRLGEARALADAAGRSVALAEKGVAPHFLGAIVCDQLPSSLSGMDLRAVIDGQQRLTTLQLLLRGVLDVLLEAEHPRASAVRKLMTNPDDVISHTHERHKLWPRRRDRELWPTAMDDTLIPSARGVHARRDGGWRLSAPSASLRRAWRWQPSAGRAVIR